MSSLFAGAPRTAELRHFVVHDIFGEFSGFELDLAMSELDVLRGGSAHDLLQTSLRDQVLGKVAAGRWQVVVMRPPCRSWSRAVWANRRGPHPLRSAGHPWGFPWTSGADGDKVECENGLVQFCLDIFEAARSARCEDGRPVLLLLEHPEDLGTSELGRPASIWQLPKIRSLASGSFFSVAFFQCRFGADFAKPTRVLSNIPGLRAFGCDEWPTFDERGYYTGPLPRACGH